MKHGKYLVASTVGLYPKVKIANTIKAALRKGKVTRDNKDGIDFMLFKADGDEIVRIDRTGRPK